MPTLTGFPSVPLPGPAPIPLLGHLPRVIAFLFDPIGRMTELSAMGDVVAVCRDSPALVCAFGSERNREVLANPGGFRNDEMMFKGPKDSSLSVINEMITCINGEVYRRHRRLMAPAFSKAKLAGYAHDVVDITERLVQRWPLEETIDLDAKLRDLSLGIAGRTLFGVDAFEEGGLGELAASYARVLTSPLALLFPHDVPGTPYRRASRLGDALLAKLGALVELKRRRAEPTHDALSMLLAAADDDGGNFTNRELMSELIALFFAGYETTAKTLTWTLFLLDRHPAILAELLEEVDEVLGGRSVTTEDFARMPRTDRVIKESMRILPALPMLFMRVAASEIALGRFTLPAGANVVISPYITQRDPTLYPEPKRFRPERWAGLEPSPFEYLPFGAGPRVCIGASFARQSLRLILPTLVQRVRFSLVPDTRIERHVQAIALAPKHGLSARLAAPHRRRHEPVRIRGDMHELVDLAS